MCGIAGFWKTKGLRADEARIAIDRMADCMRHRGPDDRGTFIDHEVGIALGFRRLAILDLTPLGHQPMMSADGRYFMVFNGEIYNHHTLRTTLEAEGVSFRGRSDTEVLCEAVAHWGIVRAFKQSAGMFAVAIWDSQRRELTLVRDRIGIKPLYVYSEDGLVSFASELKALQEGPTFSAALNMEALSQYSDLLYVPGPQSIYRHVQKLPAGTFVTISDPIATLPEPRVYWSLAEVASAGRLTGGILSASEGQSLLERALETSVAEHMEADVPLGAFLSGGIDSSLVVALMTRARTSSVKTFTVQFDDSAHDESPYAEAVAAHLKTDHTTIPLKGDDALDFIPTLCEYYDEPFADSSQIPTLMVCAAAKRHVSVVLTGDGGDELFGGYNRYLYGARVMPRLGRTPTIIRRAAARMLDAISESSLDRLHQAVVTLFPGLPQERLVGQKIKKLSRLMRASDDASRYQALVSAELLAHRQIEEHVNASAIKGTFALYGNASLMDRMLLSDQLAYLPDNQMTKVDRASMATSLEARVPLLDHRVIEVSWKLPQSSLIENGLTKAPLRKLLYRMVPQNLIDRPKTGFSVPLVRWLRGPLRPWVEECLSESNLAHSPLDRRAVRGTWMAFLNGRDGLAASVWTSLMFESWRRRWIA